MNSSPLFLTVLCETNNDIGCENLGQCVVSVPANQPTCICRVGFSGSNCEVNGKYWVPYLFDYKGQK